MQRRSLHSTDPGYISSDMNTEDNKSQVREYNAREILLSLLYKLKKKDHLLTDNEARVKGSSAVQNMCLPHFQITSLVV